MGGFLSKKDTPTAAQTAVENRNRVRGYSQNPDKYSREAYEHRQKKKAKERNEVIQTNREKAAKRTRAIQAGERNRIKQQERREKERQEAKKRDEEATETGNRQQWSGIRSQSTPEIRSENQGATVPGNGDPTKEMKSGTPTEKLPQREVNQEHVVETKKDDPKPTVSERSLENDEAELSKEKRKEIPIGIEGEKSEAGGNLYIVQPEINKGHQKDGGHEMARQIPDKPQKGRTRAATAPAPPQKITKAVEEHGRHKVGNANPHKDSHVTGNVQDVVERAPENVNKDLKNKDIHHQQKGKIVSEHDRMEHHPDLKALRHPQPNLAGRERAATAHI